MCKVAGKLQSFQSKMGVDPAWGEWDLFVSTPRGRHNDFSFSSSSKALLFMSFRGPLMSMDGVTIPGRAKLLTTACAIQTVGTLSVVCMPMHLGYMWGRRGRMKLPHCAEPRLVWGSTSHGQVVADKGAACQWRRYVRFPAFLVTAEPRGRIC